MQRQSAIIGFALLFSGTVCAADWPQFRGPEQTGEAPGTKAPLKWTATENIAWKADLPGRGLSGPIVAGGRVFITASGGVRDDQLYVLAFDSPSGRKLWERRFRALGLTSCHPKMCVATPTPATDGKYVVAFFSSNDLACFTVDGDLVWARGLNYDYPNASNTLGMASSPVIVGGTVVVQVENLADSFSAGLDLKTGANKWKLDRLPSANWASPSTLRGKNGKPDLVLLQSADRLSAHNPETGKTAWEFLGACSTIPTGLPTENAILLPLGRGGLTAVKAEVASQAPEILWKAARLTTATSSPLAFWGNLYTLNAGSVLSCTSLEDGKLRWQLRLKGPFTATPAAAGGCAYFFDEGGGCQVVRPSETKGEIVGVNDLKETILASPAVADEALFVRSDRRLWKIAEKQTPR